jgi:hypothetical protein
MKLNKVLQFFTLGWIGVAITLTSCSPRKTVSTAPPPETATVRVDWDKVVTVSKTSATLQVVVNPPLRHGSNINYRAYQAVHDLGCDYVRYVPWLPYPKLGVAELEPPKDGSTSWDFSLIDPMTEDFINATAGHSVILNFSTIPQWMFKTEKPVPYPADPDQPTWDYEQGKEFRDPSLKEVADYYARLVSWYTQGGFTDEYGKRHESGHHYKIDYWEVLNEIDLEHDLTPETYTHLYDAVVAAIRKVQPQMKFVGLALSFPSEGPKFFEYFLNPKNHQAGIPLDMISYHFYAHPSADEATPMEPYTFFVEAEDFLDTVRYVEVIRQRLSPGTRTTVDEIGSIDSSDFGQGKPGYVYKDLPQSYWNLSAATYAYVYAGLAQQGIDVAGESQLVGYPTQFPSVSLVDWNTGAGNTRYWVLKLLHDNFGPGDKLVDTASSSPYVFAQGVVTPDGKHRLLLINKRDRSFDSTIPGGDGAEVAYIDETTGFQPPAIAHMGGENLALQGLSVAVVTLSK